jgi:hypothetical protein
MTKSFEEDFQGGKIPDDAMRPDKKMDDLGAPKQEFMGFHIGQHVSVTGMPGEFVVKAFSPESSEAHLVTSMDDSYENMVMVSMDRLVKR